MSPPFSAKPIRPLWRLPACQFFRKLGQLLYGFLYMLVRPLIPYEAAPGEPDSSFVKVIGKCTNEQLALCQQIYDEGMTRRRQVEQKAQWTFTAIAFLLPTLASALFFVLQDARVQSSDQSLLVAVILGSTTLLVLSFVSALRAITVKYGQALFVYAVIEEDGTKFRSYNTEFHAKGLLYCATMNGAVNDHIAQFVKGAYTLLAVAVVGFVLGIGIVGLDMRMSGDSQGHLANQDAISCTQQKQEVADPRRAGEHFRGADGIEDAFP